MKKWSSRWIDLREYKTKDILLSIVQNRVTTLMPANKAQTYYKCQCPFHNDKTPSMKFFFNTAYGGWGYKCFGCGQSGDVFTFLMKHDRYEFWEAMVYITKRKHVFIYDPTIVRSLPRYVQGTIIFPKQEPCIDEDDDLPF